MAGFEDTAPSLDSVDLPSDLPTQNKLVEGATLYSLNDLRTAEEGPGKQQHRF